MGSNSDLVAGERLLTNLNIYRTILRLMNFSYIFLYFNMAMVISSNKYGYLPSVCLSHVDAQVCKKSDLALHLTVAIFSAC